MIRTRLPLTPRFAAMVFLAAESVWGQVTSASVSGYVLDPSGAAVAGARVAANDRQHAISRETLSDATGLYRLVDLPPASYEFAVRREGFELVSRSLTLAVDSQVRLDVRLRLAGRQESVVVPAPPRTEFAGLGDVLDRKRIESLPLSRRDFLQLALLAPGASLPVEDSELSSRGAFAMHVNGAREEYNNFLLDGVDNNDPYVNRYIIQPPVDAIQEFRIATSAYSAEYGRGAGAQVNVITRRGSNELHGFAYEYHRNRVFDARNFFDGAAQPKFVRNQFGLGAGGPLVPDRIFFFANIDFLRERRGLSRLATVPRAGERNGDLAGTGRIAVDPFTRVPFPGNVIPAARISPIARRIVDLFPLPNRPGDSGNYLPEAVQRDDQAQANARGDLHLTANDEVSLRYSFGLADLFEPYAEDTASLPGFGDTVRDPAHHATIQYQRILNPRAVNSLRVAFHRLSRAVVPENQQVDTAARLGVNWLSPNRRDSGYPSMTIAGYSKLGDATSLPIQRHSNTYQLSERLSLTRGAHWLKLGGELRLLQLNGTLDLLTRGSLSFSGAISGAGIADLLLGFPSFGLHSRSDNPQTLRATALAAFLQDDWKVRPALTVSIGLRYEVVSPPRDPTDRMSTLNFASERVVRVGTEGVPRAGTRGDRNNLAPRLGVAWSVAPGTVIRSGYGLYFDSGMMVVNSAQYFNPPQFALRVFFPTATSLLTLADPFPSTGGVSPPASLNVLSPDLTGPYLQHWNFGVERTLRPSIGLITLSYAASKGTHLIRSRDRNQPAPAPGDIQPRRPNSAFGSMLFIETAANSNYHGLQAVWNRPLERGFSWGTIYTWSKSIDDTSAFLGTKGDKNFAQDSRNYRAERGLSSFDATHRLTVTSIYALPGRNRWLRDAEIRAIVIAASGQPFTPLLRFDNSNTGNTGGTFGADRPDLTGNPKRSERGPDGWFDPAAFRVPAPYRFGSAGRNIVRAPGVFTMDLSAARRIPLSDRSAISVEAQAFNLLNRTNFSLPELYADEPASFTRIFAARPARQIQFALRFQF